MRVGIDGHMLGDRSGGNESYYTNILNNMYPVKDMELFLFVKKGVSAAAFADRFTIIEFEETGAFKRNFIELPKLCKKYKLDLLHTQYFIPFRCPCPIVCTIHDICFEHYKDIFTKKEYIRQKLLIPYAAKHSQKIFTVSENAKKDIADHYGVEEDNIIVTYNAVNNDFCVLTPEELEEDKLRVQFGIGDSRYILSVGNLQPRKNLPRLIRAFSKMEKEMDENIKLVIVGKKAWMFDGILKEACNQTDKIIFTDYVTNKDLVRLYNAAACFVYPSFFEGFGIPPLEAMACGTPVAVSNKTSLPEVVGNAGSYFDPFEEDEIMEAMRKMLRKDYCSADLKEKMKKQAERFSWKESSRLIVNTYMDVVEKKDEDVQLC
ncbi:glycosyltransferase family 4 protein [Lacrimispora sp. 210928-DFI.3.58]|uniref:glycosyltransferase family 4 protein n=1 Tax=Lacrimispora sp. 210928-DFI.3.58 TaxID=2883214 RepID=UPI0015B4AAE8|nr:glycosyltransferase family 1 protein [Lacrimispora sp. 210928-DFI.3.58]MCB7320966.1 glycosyltransferase family 4 protein [Lacrimispora sp. 210928-DFI.3.58]